MKNKKWVFSIIVVSLILLGGCVTQERIRTYEVSEVSNDTIENRVVEEYIGADKKRVVNKQVTREKVQCVGKNGQVIPAKTVTECMKCKGKVVNEVFQEDKIIKSR